MLAAKTTALTRTKNPLRSLSVRWINVSVGSKSDLTALKCDFRYAPGADIAD